MEQLLNEFHRLDSYALPDPAHPTPAALTLRPVGAAYLDRVRALADATAYKYQAKLATWDDYHALRKWMLPLYPQAELLGHTLGLRDAFNSAAAASQRETYQKMDPKPLTAESDYNTLLTHALYLQEEIARLETYRPHQELKRNFITYDLFTALFATVAIELIGSLLICYWFKSQHVHCPFVVLVMILGALGATVSYQRRLQDSFDQDGSILNTTRYVGSGVGVKLTPMQGSVFALVLLLIVCAGIGTLATSAIAITANAVIPNAPGATPVATPPAAPASPPARDHGAQNNGATPPGKKQDPGPPPNPAGKVVVNELEQAASPRLASVIFAQEAAPKAEQTPPGTPSPNASSSDRSTATPASGGSEQRLRSLGARAKYFLVGPESVVEFAKLLVFAFLAGFAERLVPDTLDRLTMKRTGNEK